MMKSPFRPIWSTLCFMAIIFMAWYLVPLYVVPGMRVVLAIDTADVFTSDDVRVGLIMPWCTWLILAPGACFAINAFKPLKRWREGGLIKILTISFLIGIGASLFFSLMGVNGIGRGSLLLSFMTITGMIMPNVLFVTLILGTWDEVAPPPRWPYPGSL